MPGIHVRTSRKYDCVEGEKEPVLTVPGSYWLCHKKNIYKFTFKYHRNLRNSKDFNYGKELMKVIRRIIKSQPRQGQQFGTHHLLVTYNHSPWTRQDKMFATLKFRDRTNASAFPRAFILTVKIFNKVSISDNDDELIVYKEDMDKSQWNGSTEDGNVNCDVNIMSQEIQSMSNITNDETSSDSSTRLTPIKSNIRANDNVTGTNTNNCNNQRRATNSASFFADLDDLPLLERYLLEQHEELEIPQQSSSSSPALNTNERLNEIQETIDMPYQYLIEREIERTNNQVTNKLDIQEKLTVDESTRKFVPENLNDEISLSQSRTNSTNNIDNTIARSANITDLVMEGLMFTIRQDQDTITVMEQKTKLEPDEVLENSEKVETKEGGECLVNSSLLKLENLITKIERSSSAVKSPRHYDDSYNNKLSISPLYSVGNDNFTEDHQISYEFSNKDKSIINPGIPDCNKSERITTPVMFKRLFTDDKHEWNYSMPPVDKINKSNGHIIVNDMLNTNNNVANVDVTINSIAEPMDEDQINKNISEKYQKNPNNELNCIIDTISNKSNYDKSKEDEDIVLEESDLNSKHSETNLLMSNFDLKQLSTVDADKLKNKLKMPRIVSSEVVKYDLSSLRSSRARKRVEFNEDDKELINDDKIRKENLSDINISNVKELQLSNEDTNHNVTMTNRRRLTAKRKLHGQKNDDELSETTIEMWKFVQDMTYGVRVVLQRLDLSRITSNISKNC